MNHWLVNGAAFLSIFFMPQVSMATLRNYFVVQDEVSGKKCLIIGETHDKNSFPEFSDVFDLDALGPKLTFLLELPADIQDTPAVRESSLLPCKIYSWVGLQKVCVDFPSKNRMGPQFGDQGVEEVKKIGEDVALFWKQAKDPAPFDVAQIPQIGGYFSLLELLKRSFQFRQSNPYLSKIFLTKGFQIFSPAIFMEIFSLSNSGMQMRNERFTSELTKVVNQENAIFPVGESHISAIHEQLSSLGGVVQLPIKKFTEDVGRDFIERI